MRRLLCKLLMFFEEKSVWKAKMAEPIHAYKIK